MNKLVINKTANAPRVMFDPERNIYELKGNSYPENTAETYEPVLNWIENELTKIESEVVFDFKLEYQNTASSKMMSSIFAKIEEAHHRKKNIKINWYYDRDDEDIVSEIQSYHSYDKLHVNLIPFDRKGKRFF